MEILYKRIQAKKGGKADPNYPPLDSKDLDGRKKYNLATKLPAKLKKFSNLPSKAMEDERMDDKSFLQNETKNIDSYINKDIEKFKDEFNRFFGEKLENDSTKTACKKVYKGLLYWGIPRKTKNTLLVT